MAKHGLGKNCENPPKDILSEVGCEKERRLKFLKTVRDEMKCGFKRIQIILFSQWNSRQEIGTENVSQLMKECEGIKLLRERSTGENVFDAERQANTCFVSGTFKQNWKWQFLLPDRTCLIQLLLNSFPIVQCFVSIQVAQVVGFPTTSGGKKSIHLVGSSASGQKSDHMVGNLTTWCSQKKSPN